jgi:hypothetical protein
MSCATSVIDAAEAPDLYLQDLEWRVDVLRELAQLGMTLTRILVEDAQIDHRLQTGILRDVNGDKLTAAELAAVAAMPRPSDPAASFARLSRAVRLTVTLQGRAHEALRAFRAGVVIEQAQRTEARARVEHDAQKAAGSDTRAARVRDLVLDVAESEVDDMEDYESIVHALDERIEGDPAYVHLADLPLKETVRRLCEDLQLTPDWSRWTGEGWTPREPLPPDVGVQGEIDAERRNRWLE